MTYKQLSIEKFTKALASGDPTPGGGGASALAGAVGAALGSMVCNLTLGKKKYADVQDDIEKIIQGCEELQKRMVDLIDEDAEAFEPLARAYGMPKDDPAREEVMQRSLLLACAAPLEIMRAAGEAVELHAQLCRKGSSVVLSDVGAGAALCKAALTAASLNVFVNSKSIKDAATAQKLEAEADELLRKYCPAADEILNDVTSRLRQS